MLIGVQAVFPGRERGKAHAGPVVFQAEHEGRTERAELAIDMVYGVVEVGAVQDDPQALLGLVGPAFDAALFGKAGVGHAELEPGPGRGGHAAVQAGRQVAHGVIPG